MSADLDPETLTRNWSELLQELRVTQTGVQILTGFLLTVPFSQRFGDLDELQRDTYLLVLCGAMLATGLLVAPVAFHRVLFRRHRRRWIVEAANKCARAGLGMFGLTTCGALFLVFDVVAGRGPAIAAGLVALAVLIGLWVVLPWSARVGRGAGPRG